MLLGRLLHLYLLSEDTFLHYMYDIEERFASIMGPNSRVLYNAWEND